MTDGAVWAFDATATYEVRNVAGWRVLYSADYAQAPQQRRRMGRYVAQQLAEVARVLPPAAVTRLRDVTIWVELSPSPDHGAVYHPDREWLIDEGMNPAKARGVELGYSDFEAHSEQPAIVLHELAHAWHDQVLGDDDPDVLKAYREARRSRVYRRSLHVSGSRERAYALHDVFEYFAEASEAYFLRNDYAPFTRAELFAQDPVGFSMIEAAWGVR